MISYPCIQTIKEGFLDPTVSFDESVKRGDWNPESEVAEHHMKAHSFEKRCIAYLTENFRINHGDMEVGLLRMPWVFCKVADLTMSVGAGVFESVAAK